MVLLSNVGVKFKRQQYNQLTDEEVIRIIREGDTEAYNYIIKKYTQLVRMKTKSYFLIGFDRDDVIQEGLIGLYKAIESFDETKKISFRTFAELCIKRQIISSIKKATRQKHSPLNTYVSIYAPVEQDDQERMLLDLIINPRSEEPQNFLIKKDIQSYWNEKLKLALTPLEYNVLMLYLKGYSYLEMSIMLKISEKSVDNALQRVKRKAKKFRKD